MELKPGNCYKPRVRLIVFPENIEKDYEAFYNSSFYLETDDIFLLLDVEKTIMEYGEIAYTLSIMVENQKYIINLYIDIGYDETQVLTETFELVC